MLKKVSEFGFGQGCCDLCRITSGWHRHWSSDLYYIYNKKQKFLVRDVISGDCVFTDDDNDRYRLLAFCYKHAIMVDDERKTKTDYE